MRVPKPKRCFSFFFFFFLFFMTFYSCTQFVPICFFSEMQNFEAVPKRPFRFFTTKHKILKPAPKWPFVFLQRNTQF